MPDYLHTNIYREKAIRELGHDLFYFDDRQFSLPGRIRDRIGFLEKWEHARLNKKIVRAAEDVKPDLTIVMGTRLPLLTKETVQKIKKINCHVVLWVTDPPRWHGYRMIEKTAPFYDYVFCAGTEHIELLERAGVIRTKWLSFACDPDYHRPLELADSEKAVYGRDIVFVGAHYPNRWEIVKMLGDFDVGIWGPSWDNASGAELGSLHIQNQRVDVTEWTRIYCASKIVLVVHYRDDKIACHQISPKVYEALGCGCFVLVDRQKDISKVFKNGKHLVQFDSPEDLKEKAAWYLDHPELRRQIAENGRREVLARHTYRHRIQTIIDTVGLI